MRRLKKPRIPNENRNSDKTRVVVAYDMHDTVMPRLYVFDGSYQDQIIKKIRRTYTEDSGCIYYDTRVMLYEHYLRNKVENKEKVEFGCPDAKFVEPDIPLESNILF